MADAHLQDHQFAALPFVDHAVMATPHERSEQLKALPLHWVEHSELLFEQAARIKAWTSAAG